MAERYVAEMIYLVASLQWKPNPFVFEVLYSCKKAIHIQTSAFLYITLLFPCYANSERRSIPYKDILLSYSLDPEKEGLFKKWPDVE